MRDELKDGLLQILLEPRTLQRGYFNPEIVRGVLDEHLRGRRNHADVLWMLLVFELWHRNFLEKIDKDIRSCPEDALYGKSTVATEVRESRP